MRGTTLCGTSSPSLERTTSERRHGRPASSFTPLTAISQCRSVGTSILFSGLVDESVNDEAAIQEIITRTANRNDAVEEHAWKNDEHIVLGHDGRESRCRVLVRIRIGIKENQFAACVRSRELMEEIDEAQDAMLDRMPRFD